jgi:sortase A
MSFLRFFGKFLISVGIGILLFVVWTLKGTDLYTHREQSRLREEFAALPRIQAQGTETDPFVPPEDFEPDHGEPVFRIEIPKIDVDEIVVEGVDRDALKRGPGHYPSCRGGFPAPLCLPEEYFPGEAGMVIVSGHRTTYGAPFWSLDKLREGDEILIEAKWGNFVYEVTDTSIVDDSTLVHAPVGEAQILLTTCNPRFSASERLLVRGELLEASEA